MFTLTHIVLAVASLLLVALVVVPGIRALRYSRSEQWKLQQRIRRICQREAE
jgi:hypothetical protein